MFKCMMLYAALGIFVACGVSPDDEYGLHYLGEDPLILTKGDTSQVLEFKRIGIFGYKGEMKTDENYQKVKLTHQKPKDSLKLEILELRILALDTTSDSGVVVKAIDKESNYTARFHVQIVSP